MIEREPPCRELIRSQGRGSSFLLPGSRPQPQDEQRRRRWSSSSSSSSSSSRWRRKRGGGGSGGADG